MNKLGTALILGTGLLVALSACTGGSDDDSNSGGGTAPPTAPTTDSTPTKPGTDNTPTKPGTGSATSGGSSSTATSSLGPNCTAYVECCKQVATAQPALQQACDTMDKNIEAAKQRGVSSEQFESACKQAVDVWKQTNQCK
jgi:hypothetical protein